MKPECQSCGKGEGEGGLSQVFGKDFVEDLTYGMFNPEGLGNEENKSGMDIDEMVKQAAEQINSDSMDEFLQQLLSEAGDNWVYRDWIEEYAKREKAREQVWQSIMEKVKNGEIDPSQIPVKQMLRNFPKMIMQGLSEEGLLEFKMQKHRFHPEVHNGYAEMTIESERVIAKRVLEEAFINLEKFGFGLHEVKESGHGTYPSNILKEYDWFLHAYDLLDVQETMLSTALRDPSEMMLTEDDLKVRLPLHRARSSNIILVDISYSMYGNKFKGGVMAALALRQLLEEEFKEDVLHVVAYNHEATLVPKGEVLRLRPHGNTDIGRAIDVSRDILVKEEGNKNVFLITDSEPTASYNRNQSPEANAYRAAIQAGLENIRLNVIMLDPRPGLRVICERMARLNGNALVTYVDNPLNLKEFVIRTYVDMKTRGRRHS
ncbi:MAG: hypothetical protein HYU39_01495 [Thaumarchaeota archaeon]|nr:hypothetical protein [Nitrososphaerota archaeon]